MSNFDTDFPLILGVELTRPRPQYITRYVTQPQFVWDPSLTQGKQAQLDRYNYFGDSGDLTLESRRRSPTQIIGSANQRQITKDKVFVTIDEYTGPSAGDPNNPSNPGNLVLSEENIKLAQRFLYDPTAFDSPQLVYQFHQSIGSLTLLDDFQRWQDRSYVNTLLQSTFTYNPQGVDDGGTYASGPPKIDIRNDLNTIAEQMESRNVPKYDDGYYYGILSPRMLKHFRQDEDFRRIAASASFVPSNMVRDPRIFAPAQMPPAGIDYMVQPNQLVFQGMGFNQASFGNPIIPAGMGFNQASFGNPMMPAGIVFEGFRLFMSNNLPTAVVNLNYTASTNPTRHPTGAANRTAYLGVFIGKEAVGEAMGTDMPTRVKKNENSDYGRFLILIWQTFWGLQLLNPSFVTVARTYAD
jgi:hypothetical protein